MKDIYLLNYSVKGIKSLDQLVSLSFYKKIIPKNPDTQNYNIKGIYGMNGSGKSGIVASVEILKNLLTNSSYLSNPIVQKHLDAMINKKLGELYIEVNYLVKTRKELLIFSYNVTLAKDNIGKYVISKESLYAKKATSKSENRETVFEVMDGKIEALWGLEKKNDLSTFVFDKTINLLSAASICVLFYEKMLLGILKDKKGESNFLLASLVYLKLFGEKIHVFLDEADNHRKYEMRNTEPSVDLDWKINGLVIERQVNKYVERYTDYIHALEISDNMIQKAEYQYFEKMVQKLYEFLHIFKPDLQNIEIDKKENHDLWICDLVMIYDSYKIHAEYESTGIKKLIRLFAYLKEMVNGGIVFIDEFDSNLHDVYLCALLEYLMEYAEGQLCFTTHNVGPMDVLRQHKKSIEFLSENHQIYSWTTNGNYSPSKLYREGMIEGSPFNVDSIDFIGVFGAGGEDV